MRNEYNFSVGYKLLCSPLVPSCSQNCLCHQAISFGTGAICGDGVNRQTVRHIGPVFMVPRLRLVHGWRP